MQQWPTEVIFRTRRADKRLRVVCERLKVALPVSVRGAFIKQIP